MADANQNADHLRKKLRFQCQYRGTRELDLVLGPFAAAYLDDLAADELQILSDFLSESDPDIYDWLSGHTALPARLRSAVTDRLVAYGRRRLTGEGT